MTDTQLEGSIVVENAARSFGEVQAVRATLETTARLYRMDAASAAARANELIALVGLE